MKGWARARQPGEQVRHSSTAQACSAQSGRRSPGDDVFGGASEIGGNRILLSWDDAAWMLDFGTRFAATSRYFEEFVKPGAPRSAYATISEWTSSRRSTGSIVKTSAATSPISGGAIGMIPTIAKSPSSRACCSRVPRIRRQRQSGPQD